MTLTPVREGLVQPFPEDAGGVRIIGSRCLVCGEASLGINTVCLNCGADALQTMPLANHGTLWTYTVVRHRPPGAYLGPEPFRPFGLGLIELPDGLRVMSPLDGDPESFTIGQPMRLVRRVLHTPDGVGILAFAFAAV